MDQIDDKTKSELRSIKHISFAWQETKTMKLIRDTYQGKKRTTAVAIYQSLTECACEEGRKVRVHTSRFVASLGRISTKSGKSVSTIKRYVKEFRKLNVLVWTCKKRGKINLSNEWKLLKCPDQNDGPTPSNDNEPRVVAHDNELEKKERLRKYITNKGNDGYHERGGGFKPIKDIL